MEEEPWFKFYPHRWMHSPAVLGMTTLQVGAYLRLLLYQWGEGYIPSDEEKLRDIMRLGNNEDFQDCLVKVVKKCFKPKDDDEEKLINPLLDEQRTSTQARLRELSEVRSEAGRRGGEARAEKFRGMQNFVIKRKQEAEVRQSRDPQEQLRILQEAAGENLQPWNGPLRPEHAEMLEKCTAEELQIFGAHIAAGEHWIIRKGGDLPLTLFQVLSKVFESNLAQAVMWDKSGRPAGKKKHTYTHTPLAPITGPTRKIKL